MASTATQDGRDVASIDQALAYRRLNIESIATGRDSSDATLVSGDRRRGIVESSKRSTPYYWIVDPAAPPLTDLTLNPTAILR